MNQADWLGRIGKSHLIVDGKAGLGHLTHSFELFVEEALVYFGVAWVKYLVDFVFGGCGLGLLGDDYEQDTSISIKHAPPCLINFGMQNALVGKFRELYRYLL